MPKRSILLVVATLALGRPLHGQIFMGPSGERRPHTDWLIDIAPQYARPVGEFRANVDEAWGVGMSVRYRIPGLGPLGVRLDGAFLNYGNERKEVRLSPQVNRVLVDMNTSNNIAVVTGGPELAIRRGAIRPYVFAFAGFSSLFTQSSVGDDSDGGAFASTTNFDDGGLATGWGGGLRIPLRMRRADIGIDLGARLTRNGTRSYLRRGDITDLADGSLQFNERRTSVDFRQYQVGVSIAPNRRARR